MKKYTDVDIIAELQKLVDSDARRDLFARLKRKDIDKIRA